MRATVSAPVAPETVTGLPIYADCIKRLQAHMHTLADKPGETVEATLEALWKTAAVGMLVKSPMLAEMPMLDADATSTLYALIAQRINGTPLAYLTGHQLFMGLTFKTTDAALIPRKETELLGEAALARLRQCVEVVGRATVIDVCTGCGNLALALAYHEPRAEVYGADLSENAVALASENARRLNLGGRVSFRAGDLLAPFDSSEFHRSVDLLVCNPPYISSAKVDQLPTEIIGHEPRLAFDGGPLGIRILQRLINAAPTYIRPGGWLVFEVGLGQGRGIDGRLQRQGSYAEIAEIYDHEGQVRALAARVI